MELSKFTIKIDKCDKFILYSVLSGKYVEIEKNTLKSLLSKKSINNIVNKLERELAEQGYFKEEDFDEVKCLMYILKGLYFSGKRIDLKLTKGCINKFNMVSDIINSLSDIYHVYLHVDNELFGICVNKFQLTHIITEDFRFFYQEKKIYRIIDKVSETHNGLLKDLLKLYYYESFVNVINIEKFLNHNGNIIEFAKMQQEDFYTKNYRGIEENLLILQNHASIFLKNVNEGYYEIK